MAVTQDEAVRLLTELGAGGVAWKDVAALSQSDIEAIAKVGASALQAGRFDVAERVFAALVALDPQRAVHLLHRGVALQRAGKRDDAVASVTEFLDADLPKDPADVAAALLLRAELVGVVDKAAAARDLGAAKALAQLSPQAKQIVDGAWR